MIDFETTGDELSFILTNEEYTPMTIHPTILAICGTLIDDALEAGYSLNLDNGDGYELAQPTTDKEKMLEEMFATDEEYLIYFKAGKPVGHVWLIHSNSPWETVTDYTVGLEPVLAGAEKVAEEAETAGL